MWRAPEVKFTVEVRHKSRVQSYNMLRDLNFTSMEIYATAQLIILHSSFKVTSKNN